MNIKIPNQKSNTYNFKKEECVLSTPPDQINTAIKILNNPPQAPKKKSINYSKILNFDFINN
jgi:hypothetical protein